MHAEKLEYEAHGLNMVGDLCIGDGNGKRPGILLFPDMSGISDHTRARARDLGELGYVALACDLHGNAHTLSGMDEVLAVRETLIYDPQAIRARARGGLEALLKRPEVDPSRVGAMGFCFGGRMALELARAGEDLACAVAFHAGLRTEAVGDSRNIKGKVLVCTGSEDSMATAEDRAAFEAEMMEGGVDWQLHLYGGVYHSFTNPDAAALNRPDFARYDAKADARSWTSMLNLFDEVFARQ
jgi:dienelactone hydrolase